MNTQSRDEQGRDVAHLLNGLIELDFDAIEAYKAAIARLNDATDRSQLSQFLEDHRRHVTALTPLVRSLGGTPSASADIKRILTKGKVVLGALIGDRAVLQAMRSNEETTNRVYDRALSHRGLTPQIRDTLDRNLADERRHLSWIEQRLARAERHAHP